MAYFSFTKHRAYLDWASAAPVHPKALAAFDAAVRLYGNPSSPHTEGVKAREALATARTQIARLAGVKSDAVIFTSGATEANALAIQGRIKKMHDEGVAYENMHILYLPTMHASVISALMDVSRRGVVTEAITLNASGAINIEAFSAQLTPATVLVCADVVCGETGIRFDTLRLRRAIDAASYTHTALLHIDASQLPLVEQIEHTRLGADFMTLDAQKVGAVRGIGALIAPRKQMITAIVQGGGQEYGLRPGTEPVALTASFAAALTLRSTGAQTFSKAAELARSLLVQTIQSATPEACVITGKKQAPHILNMQFPGIDTDYLVMLLDASGYAVATRSACETDSENGSQAVRLLTGDAERSKATLRISWGPETSTKDLQSFAKALISSLRFLTENAI